MKAKTILSALLLLVAGIQTAAAQGFRVYKSDGTIMQFSLRTDSIVFYDGIGTDVDFGPFTSVNQMIAGTWYKSRNETVTFREDGTTDYIAGGTYRFLPYQGEVLVYDSSKKLRQVIRVHDISAEELVVSTFGSTTFSVWSTTQPPQSVTSITLSPASLSLQPNETSAIAATVLPADADNKEVEWASSDEAVAVVGDFFGTITVMAKSYGTCTITCTAKDGSGVKAECQVTVKQTGTNGHEYVEIGGLKWATMNVGATTVAGSYETCYGDYYAWGETQPRYMTITRSGTNSASFTWRNGYSSGYSSDNYPTYTGTTLDASHDAATANWGSTWRTPTKAEFEALAAACSGSSANNQKSVELINAITEGGIYWLSSTQTIESAYTGVAGLLFVSASDISKRVFFPAAGYVFDSSLYYGGTNGSYWSSSLLTSNSSRAYSLNFNSSSVSPSSLSNRCYGFTVRPVSD